MGEVKEPGNKATKMKDCNAKQFDLEKLRIGPHLGSGGFASVYGVLGRQGRGKSLELGSPQSPIKDQTQRTVEAQLSVDSLSVSSSHSSDDSSDGHDQECVVTVRLALKKLSRQTLSCPRKTKIAIHDIHNEVKVLSLLPEHPNIIRLHGVSKSFWESSQPGHVAMILERLAEPLDAVIHRWRKESKAPLKWVTRSHLHRRSQAERINNVAIPVANALAFLHKQMVIYRDLKPNNIGFDPQGTIKLFDFGLARKLKKERSNLVGRNGTLRYMAPEVASKEVYTFSADVYSFGNLLWELCTLEKPFRRIKEKEQLNPVVMQKDKHPSVGPVASVVIKDLLTSCWDAEPVARPSIASVKVQLEAETGMALPRSSSLLKR